MAYDARDDVHRVKVNDEDTDGVRMAKGARKDACWIGKGSRWKRLLKGDSNHTA